MILQANRKAALRLRADATQAAIHDLYNIPSARIVYSSLLALYTTVCTLALSQFTNFGSGLDHL